MCKPDDPAGAADLQRASARVERAILDDGAEVRDDVGAAEGEITLVS